MHVVFILRMLLLVCSACRLPMQLCLGQHLRLAMLRQTIRTHAFSKLRLMPTRKTHDLSIGRRNDFRSSISVET